MKKIILVLLTVASTTQAAILGIAAKSEKMYLFGMGVVVVGAAFVNPAVVGTGALLGAENKEDEGSEQRIDLKVAFDQAFRAGKVSEAEYNEAYSELSQMTGTVVITELSENTQGVIGKVLNLIAESK